MNYKNIKRKALEYKQSEEESLKELKESLYADATLFKNFSLSYLSKKDRNRLEKSEQIEKIIAIMNKDILDVYLSIIEKLDAIFTFHIINNFDITVYNNTCTMLIEGSRFKAKRIVTNTSPLAKVLNQSLAIQKLLCDFKENSPFIDENDSTVFKCKMRNTIIPTFSLYNSDKDIIRCFELLGFKCDTRYSNGITYYSFNREVK